MLLSSVSRTWSRCLVGMTSTDDGDIGFIVDVGEERECTTLRKLCPNPTPYLITPEISAIVDDRTRDSQMDNEEDQCDGPN